MLAWLAMTTEEQRLAGLRLVVGATVLGLIGVLILVVIGLAWRRYFYHQRHARHGTPMPDIWKESANRVGPAPDDDDGDDGDGGDDDDRGDDDGGPFSPPSVDDDAPPFRRPTFLNQLDDDSDPPPSTPKP